MSVVSAERLVMMHAGGWDEILLVVGPVLIIAVLIIVARKQVPVDSEDGEDAGEDTDPPASRSS